MTSLLEDVVEDSFEPTCQSSISTSETKMNIQIRVDEFHADSYPVNRFLLFMNPVVHRHAY
jgi:hypothetical protein